MLPWTFSEEAAAEKHMAQLQHNMWVTSCKLVGALNHYRRRQMGRDQDVMPIRSTSTSCSRPKRSSGAVSRAASRLACSELSRRGRGIEAVRVVDMSSSNAWAEFAGLFRAPGRPYLEHENAKAELKTLMPEDAKEAIGHGIRAKRSKSGAISFDALGEEATMHRSSESIGAIAAALAKAQAELTNPEKSLSATHPVAVPQGGRPDLPLRLTRKRPGHHPQER